MVQRGQDFGLTVEAGEALRVGREGLGQNLERDVTFQTCVASTVDFTHATRAERRVDDERADAIPGVSAKSRGLYVLGNGASVLPHWQLTGS